MVEKYVEYLKPIVNRLFKQDSGGHDVSHMERTMKITISKIARAIMATKTTQKIIELITPPRHPPP